MKFQWIFGAAVLLLIFRLVYMLYSRKLKLRRFVFYAGFWAAVLLAITFPEATNRIAHFFNITRGADFFIYLSIIVIFYLLFKMFERLENMEKSITEVVKRVALLGKELEDKSGEK